MDLTHGKYLAVDYGDVRTGLAECDISGSVSTGIGTVKPGGMRRTAEYVAKEAAARDCRRIVIGLPKNMNGSQGSRTEAVRAFGDILRELTDIPIDYYDERMTTMAAYRYMDEVGTFGKKRKNNIDTLSAEIILQDYLDAEKRKRP